MTIEQNASVWSWSTYNYPKAIAIKLESKTPMTPLRGKISCLVVGIVGATKAPMDPIRGDPAIPIEGSIT